MLKLLICLFCSAAAAILLLELRQQRINLSFRTDELHNRIEASQAQLWNQQLSIAVCTAPPALAAELRDENLKLAPVHPAAGQPAWVQDPDAAQ